MADVTIKYNGSDIATMDASGTKTMQTSGKYCEGDIQVVYADPEKPTQTKTANPSTSAVTVTPDSGNLLSSVTVNPITSSLLADLDADFVAENIKKDIDLFGLVGTLEDGGGGAAEVHMGRFVPASSGVVASIPHGFTSVPDIYVIFKDTTSTSDSGVTAFLFAITGKLSDGKYTGAYGIYGKSTVSLNKAGLAVGSSSTYSSFSDTFLTDTEFHSTTYVKFYTPMIWVAVKLNGGWPT